MNITAIGIGVILFLLFIFASVIAGAPIIGSIAKANIPFFSFLINGFILVPLSIFVIIGLGFGQFFTGAVLALIVLTFLWLGGGFEIKR